MPVGAQGIANRVLLIHCHYRLPGGEDTVFKQEGNLLSRSSLVAKSLSLSNDTVDTSTWHRRMSVGVNTIWSMDGYRRISQAILDFRPDVVHFHNTFPQLSPSVYYACVKFGVPVIQTLHNYRLLCAAGVFLRDGAVCTDCAGGAFYHAVSHRCYRDSSAASTAVVAMQYTHHLLGTYRHKVDRYIALTEFARQQFIAGGLPADRIIVKPNFVSDPAPDGSGLDGERHGALYVGRLSREKGVDIMLEAWREIDYPLTIIGEGPLLEGLPRLPQVRFLGWQDSKTVAEWMRRSAFLTMPSVWYEGFPMVILEAYANGLPVLASRLGSLAEVVRDGVTGLHFTAGNAADLARVVKQAIGGEFDTVTAGRRARQEYLDRYTPERNIEQLLQIYRDAIQS